jgi:hypothetical protein
MFLSVYYFIYFINRDMPIGVYLLVAVPTFFYHATVTIRGMVERET